MNFMAVGGVEKTFWFYDLLVSLRKVCLQQFKLGTYVKGVSFVNRRYTKGVSLLSKMVQYIKRLGVGPQGRASPYETLLNIPPFRSICITCTWRVEEVPLPLVTVL